MHVNGPGCINGLPLMNMPNVILPRSTQYKKAKGVASFVYTLFCQRGVPKHIQSDQGSEFVNSLNQSSYQESSVSYQ